MGKGFAVRAMRKAALKLKKVQRLDGKPRVNNSAGFFSGDCVPNQTVRGAQESEAALEAGALVLEISGCFMKVPLSQRLKFAQSCPGRVRNSEERFNGYRGSKTLKEALSSGASPDDLYYDLKHGALAFVPHLRAKKVDGPLPLKEWPPGVRLPDEGRIRPFWLPDEWAWGVKTTCPTYLPAFVAPNKRIYYHRPVIERIVQHQLGGVEGMQAHGAAMIREHKFWSGKVMEFHPDERLFKILTKKERMHLPSIEELHFCVVSARRATERTGIRGIVNVQSQFLKSGASPTWYVDKNSAADYKKLGLTVVVGGKLTPARNMALRDAQKLGKACVQVSDDISRWEYHKGSLGELKGFDGSEKLAKANEKVRSKDRIIVSPVAAARFLLAKMRAAEPRPRLGGVFPTGNAAMGLLCEATSDAGFILGDFFVHDCSPCRFDTQMTLKEDYDFTCTHLKRHGCVLRCNRLVIHVAHETNSGGAVSVRAAGRSKEQQNIAILKRKWPGVFRKHGTRGADQVVLRWSKRET